MNVLHSILTKAWLIDENFLDANAMQIVRLLQGETNIFQHEGETVPVCTLYNVATGMEVGMNDASRTGESNDTKYVAIFRVKGVLTKYDQECGPSGTMTLHKAMQRAKVDPNIIAGVLDCDSPGGEASYIHTVATEWANFGKPTRSWITGLNASACLYISAGSEKSYSNEKTDLHGSIGTMMTIADMKGYFEKQGLKIHEIFAKQSSKKGSLIRQALEGNYKPLQETILSPMAEQFINFVKTHRNITDEAAFEGKIYNAKEAKRIGMIDGFKSLDAVLKEAHKAGMKHHQKSIRNSSNINNMSYLEKIKAKFGLSTIKAEDGKLTISEEEGQKLLVSQHEELETLTAKNKDLEAKLTELTQKVEANEKAIQTNAKDIKNFGDDTTEEPTSGNATEDPANANVNTDGEPKVLTEEEKYGKYYQ